MAASEKFSVAIGNTQERYACAADQTLLGGMEQLGRRGIPVGCRGGGCGVCKVRIEAGSVRCERMSRRHVSAEEETQGYVLACRAYPQSNLQLQAATPLARCLDKRARNPSPTLSPTPT